MNERAVYRFLHVLLLSGIVLLCAGNYLGIQHLELQTGFTLLSALAVAGSFAGLKLRGRVSLLAGLGTVLVAV
ncbi:MAG: hypothetical protein IJ833_10515, partial [Lachnospiraceae bacterium]|nr:hypothetical protein [Lachnospiraceae bacterium]